VQLKDFISNTFMLRELVIFWQIHNLQDASVDVADKDQGCDLTNRRFAAITA
jgi:hypothetical protein